MSNAKKKIVLRDLLLLSIFVAIMALSIPIAIAEEVPAHVVISEVQIATTEFVELYNPTNSAIDLTDGHWCYFSSGRDWNNSK